MGLCYRVDSLHSICINYVSKDVHQYSLELLKLLPHHSKNQLLKKFTSKLHKQAYNLQQKILAVLVNSSTDHIDLTLYPNIDDELLKVLIPCRNLRVVHLTRYKARHSLTAQGLLNVLPVLKKLHMLEIAYCDAVTNDVIKAVVGTCINLEAVDLKGCRNVADDGVRSLATLENLAFLNLSETKISDKAILCLINGPNRFKIRELRLCGCYNLYSVTLTNITVGCPNIETLDFCSISEKSDDNIQMQGLTAMKQMTWTIPW